MEFIKLVLFSICFKCVLCMVPYKASVLDVSNIEVDKYEFLILDAAKKNIDILLLSSPTKSGVNSVEFCGTTDNYDEVLKSVSKYSKCGGIYVVLQLFEKTKCHHTDEVMFNNVVFDRHGRIVAVYRQPLNADTKCNTTDTITKFTTDFDVTFAIVTEEDIFLHSIEYFDNIKNFIVSSSQNIPNLIAEQFTSSWSYVGEVNVISPLGIFGGKLNNYDNVTMAELQKQGGSSSLITTKSVNHHNTKTLNIGNSYNGYTDTICDGGFCCNFYVKTANYEPEANYYLSASEVVLQLKENTVNIKTCVVGSKDNIDIKFDTVSISGNFTNSVLYPTASTVQPTSLNTLNIKNNTIELYNTNVVSFGVLSKCNVNVVNETNEYITYENVQDFFDYVWIRVRVLLFIVSIYVLEMM